MFENNYLKLAKQSLALLSEAKIHLFKIWEEGKNLESERIRTIKTLYEDIVTHN